MKLRYSPRAARDLAGIFYYLAQRSPRGATNVMAAVFAATEFIRRHPDAAPAVPRIPGVRAVIARRYPFKVFYRVLLDEDVVEIVHVRHAARRPWKGDDNT
ncbi:MAG: type II toxin-antitoxin system RelE/ParE family toxin [Hyphomicrobiales bacterium]|nr:type II toxin-antitoxin system RelE/ParE family toxin [Hyphomicrobiales bacterium]